MEEGKTQWPVVSGQWLVGREGWKTGRLEGRKIGRLEEGEAVECCRGGISIALPIRSVDLIVPLIARVLGGDQRDFSWVSSFTQPNLRTVE